VVARWRGTPRWQYFPGGDYYKDRLPCDVATQVKSHQLLSEDGVVVNISGMIN
jgi:IS5 family transposase